MRTGLRFAFAPNFSALTPEVVLAAIGQAFYATGVGMAMMLAYGSYMARGTSLVRPALYITGSILLVSLLATLTIFPLVFRYGMDPAQGSELVFDVLATVFAEMPGGRLIGTLFFLLLVLAALTPSIAGIEPVVAWLEQHRGASRPTAVMIAAGGAWVLGLGSVLSFNLWAGWHPLGFLPLFADKTVFDCLDYVTSNILLPVGALRPASWSAGSLTARSSTKSSPRRRRSRAASASGCCAGSARSRSPRSSSRRSSDRDQRRKRKAAS